MLQVATSDSSIEDTMHTQDAALSDPSSIIPSRQDRYTNDEIGGAIYEARDQEHLLAYKRAVQKPEPLTVVPEDNQYIVERILSHKVNHKGGKKAITHYLVKWEGYPDEENSLVDEIYEDLIKAYTTTAEQLLRKRSVRLGRRKKIVTQYLVK